MKTRPGEGRHSLSLSVSPRGSSSIVSLLRRASEMSAYSAKKSGGGAGPDEAEEGSEGEEEAEAEGDADEEEN
jgi:hypothetical protein